MGLFDQPLTREEAGWLKWQLAKVFSLACFIGFILGGLFTFLIIIF